MPPLNGEFFSGTPKPEAEIALIVKDRVLRESVYKRMNDLLPMPVRKRGYAIESPKAIYTTHDQEDNERTRAWLTRRIGRVSGESTVYLVTDKILDTEDNVSLVPDSQITHLGLARDYTVYTNHYLGLNALQQVELMETVNDTLHLIEQEILQK